MEDDNHGNKCCEAEDGGHCVPEGVPLSEVEFDKDWKDQEELHFTGEVPGPAHACVALSPRNQVVDEEQVPEPVIFAVVHVVEFEEERPLSATKYDHKPEHN